MEKNLPAPPVRVHPTAYQNLGPNRQILQSPLQGQTTHHLIS